MKLTPEQTRHVAHLARLKLEDGEVERYAAELSAILDWVEQLGELDTDAVPPLTSVTPMQVRIREDRVTDGDMAAKVLANAPETEADFFVVPKVVE